MSNVRHHTLSSMKILTERIGLKTSGAGDLIDITARLNPILKKFGLSDGLLTVFCAGSTLGVACFEYEPGLIKDMKGLYEKLASSDERYAHDAAWGDANGFSHLRSALQGTSMSVPFENGKLMLGTWQQVVIAEFDNRPRSREIIVQLMGE
ncbi:MAG: secondary thiamine-phosphate synthase enzyme YjbQ [bacterium]